MQHKKTNELMAYTYSHLYSIPVFRPEVLHGLRSIRKTGHVVLSFTDKYFRNEPIRIFNNGDIEDDLYRDFTYIDDIIEGIVRVLVNPPAKTNNAAHRVLI